MFCALVVLGAVLLDQVSKELILAHLNTPVSIIPGVISFEYAENTGMAWGMLKDHRWVFMTLSVLALVFFSVLYYKIKKPHPLFTLSMGFVLGGGVGNMIDRIFRPRGAVIDFFRTDFMDFPIFNVADIFITVGAVLLCVYLLFFDRKQEHPLVFEKKEETNNDGPLV